MKKAKLMSWEEAMEETKAPREIQESLMLLTLKY